MTQLPFAGSFLFLFYFCMQISFIEYTVVSRVYNISHVLYVNPSLFPNKCNFFSQPPTLSLVTQRKLKRKIYVNFLILNTNKKYW
ncbi:hypothetical protein GLOIN_2v1697605 [Rhizophagus irregularis DAOM 181602=DAOM 197198]|uniref:Uncharacterized protein n=1 Tax=Rhizophagus irregularis (strain DAOM 181602 / DAOM 197198 / MUCL 43194) TaxID=747089 RepID=A0A2P4PA66_RHIID|nr:hypothetical protein GLOIN_2v1697605 [Rhizophagus irregularis DAOM 181602=DAOM 197198]POG62257.1 hypothetical protein GLOIN_2v1697605 [Rhizophagus irregularis DAOM 181602=DAOM 197198]GET56374.1 hypothetical protein GLOIN_2v1697605 [Rhizophagus irregularis DAOM 181602=DAOM 197198]|eukprot:XP_025169123.1 hypothetical protein GLOIN_2v1697605 [Rhizophagus irregularis DAOM 181602=DAOM 197198]